MPSNKYTFSLRLKGEYSYDAIPRSYVFVLVVPEKPTAMAANVLESRFRASGLSFKV